MSEPKGYDTNGTNLSLMVANSLTFKGRVGVGMGSGVAKEPIPILAFPLKGKGRIVNHLRFPCETEIFCQFFYG